MSTSEKPVFKYVQPEADASGRRIAKGKLKVGLKIEGEYQKEFVLREAVMSDLFAAEVMVGANRAMAFEAAIWCGTLQSIGNYQGPFTVGMLGLLRQDDFAILREAQMELDTSGE